MHRTTNGHPHGPHIGALGGARHHRINHRTKSATALRVAFHCLCGLLLSVRTRTRQMRSVARSPVPTSTTPPLRRPPRPQRRVPPLAASSAAAGPRRRHRVTFRSTSTCCGRARRRQRCPSSCSSSRSLRAAVHQLERRKKERSAPTSSARRSLRRRRQQLTHVDRTLVSFTRGRVVHASHPSWRGSFLSPARAIWESAFLNMKVS